MTPEIEFMKALLETYGLPGLIGGAMAYAYLTRGKTPDAGAELAKAIAGISSRTEALGKKLDEIQKTQQDDSRQLDEIQKTQQDDSRQLDRIEIHASRGAPVTHWNSPTQPPR